MVFSIAQRICLLGLALLAGARGLEAADGSFPNRQLPGGAFSDTSHLISSSRSPSTPRQWSPLHLPVNGLPHAWQPRPARAATQFILHTVGEYNDNVLRSSVNELEDYIVTSLVEVDAAAPLPGGLTLRMRAGLGAESYLDHSERVDDGDRIHFIAVPGSEVSLEAHWEPVRLRLYDRFGLQHSPTTDFLLQQTEILSWMQNEAGADLQWQMGDHWTLDLNYAHTLLDSRSTLVTPGFDEESLFDRESNVIRAALAWSPRGTWSLGLEGSLGWHQSGSYQNDSRASTLGLALRTRLGKRTHLHLGAGVQRLEYDSPPEFERTVTRADLAEAEDAVQTKATETRTETVVDEELAAQAADLANRRRAIQAQINEVSKQLEIARQAGDAALVAALEDYINQLLAELSSLPADFTASASKTITTTNNQAEVEAARERLKELQQRRAAEDRVFVSHHRDASELTDYYAHVTLQQQLGRRLEHVLMLGHESALNSTSNFITSDFVAWRLAVQAWRGAEFSLGAYYEWAGDSGGHSREELAAEGIADYIAHRQTYDQYGADAVFSQRITRGLRLVLGGHFSRLDTETAALGYDEIAAHAGLVFTLGWDTELSLGWRFTTVSAADSAFDYEQNRALISLRHRF